MNKCLFFGEVVRQPEFKLVGPQNTPLVNFTLLVSRPYKTRNGEAKVEKQYLDFEAWDTSAENIRDNVNEGDEMFVESCAKKDSWEDKETQQKRSRVKFRAESFRVFNSNNAQISSEPVATSVVGEDEPIPF